MRSPIPSPWDSASTGVLAVLPSPDSWEELLGPALPVPGGMVLRVLVLLFFLALLVRIAQFHLIVIQDAAARHLHLAKYHRTAARHWQYHILTDRRRIEQFGRPGLIRAGISGG